MGTWLINVGSRAALSMSDAIRPDNMHPLTQTLTSVLGKPTMRAWSDNLMDAYRNSTYYQGAELGLGGQSLQNRIRMPLFNRDESNRSIRLQMARVEPRILINGIGDSSMRPFFINAQSAISDAFIHASEATHDFLFRLNKDNPNFDPQANALNVRRIVGDPAESGIGRIPQELRSIVPYANVAVQGARAMTSELTARPINTSLGMVTGYGSLIALGLLTAFQSKENLQHYTNDLSVQQRASNLVIYNGPHGESSAILIPYPQEARWATPLITEGLFHGFNLAGAAHDKTSRTDVLQFLKSLAFEHVDKATNSATLHGVNDAFNFLDWPVYLKAGMALAGGSGKLDLAKVVEDAQTGNLGINTLVQPGSNPKALPNESPDDAAARNANGKRWHEVLSSVFGLAGATIDHVMVTAGAPYYARLADMDFDEARRALQEHPMLMVGVARYGAAKVRPGGTLLFMGGATAPAAYFSLDGGTTKIADYGQNSDASDFLNSGVQGPNDPFNEFYNSGTAQQLTAVDLKPLVTELLASPGGLRILELCRRLRRMVRELAEQGAAILLISSELPELLNLSDRILVLRAGRMVGEVARAEANQERLLRLMAGLA